MRPFKAKNYSDIATTSLGKKLWEFLNEERSLIRLDTASFLKRPALEAIQPQLQKQFGAELETLRDNRKLDRWKQMMGRMVLEIMKARGYEIDQRNVRIRAGKLFTTATRYKLKETNEEASK